MRSNTSLFFVLLALLGCANLSASTYVYFRMDDAQDWWLTQTQQDVINVFKEGNYPLTVGIIANAFGVGDDTMINAFKNYINYAKTNNWNFEICDHGWNHEDFTTFTLAEQIDLLTWAKASLLGNLSGYITADDLTSFIPPFNYINDDTLTAMRTLGFRAMSSDISWYTTRAYPAGDATFREFPIGSATTNLADTAKIDAQASFDLLQTQIQIAGYGGVMMHFTEFTYTDDSGNDVTNQTSINDLKKFIQMCLDAGYTLTTIKDMGHLMFGDAAPVHEFNSGSGSTPPPAVATTGKAPVATTGKAAVATTGKAAVATTGKAAVATTGKASVATTASSPVATTGKAAVATTGKTAVATTGKASVATTGKAAVSPPASSGSGTVSIRVDSSWSNGYCATILATNSGSVAWTSWTAVFSMSSGAISSSWGFTYTQSGNTYTATPVSWAESVPAGTQSTNAGFCGTFSGTMPTFTATITETTN